MNMFNEPAPSVKGKMDGMREEPPLPFELVMRGNGVWRSRWKEEQLFIVVGGTDEAPAPALMETLRRVVFHWSDVKGTIATYVRGLAGGEHVPLDPAKNGGFAAASCGFDQPLSFESILVESIDAPTRVAVTFYTGYPDGYATYKVTLENGVPIGVGAFAS